MYFCGVKMTILSILFALTSFVGFSQFVGPAGTSGSTAMYKDSSAFVNWANSCSLQLGLVDISNPFSGFANVGDANSPTGIPDGMTVSLGDSGVAVLTFSQSITNENGPDFAVFENGFSDNFLELAFVEVSSDGINFTRFPAVSNTQTDIQIAPYEASADATLLNNLAGKYRANYGTPFELEELSGTPGLDINAISHVKIIDVVGKVSGDHVQFDSNGNPINDPHPTAFPAGGFDLDAVGVIHQAPLGVNDFKTTDLNLYPNPVLQNGVITVSTSFKINTLTLIDLTGNIVSKSESSTIQLNNCPSGIFLLRIQSEDSERTVKVVVQ